MIVTWFTPARRSFEWFGQTEGTLALIERGGTSAVASVIGAAGQGVPSGGEEGQILAKIDATDFNSEWIAPPSGEVAAPTFSAEFTPLTGQTQGIIVESNAVTATGRDDWLWPLVARGGEVQINAQEWGPNGDIRTGDTVKMRLTTASTGLTETVASLYGQGFTRLWSVETADVSIYDLYAANGFTPPLVADYKNEVYAVDGVASTFDDMHTFARASEATYTDSDGILQTVAAGVPRRGNHVWDGDEWVNEGVLIESAAATNLVSRSNDFSFTDPWAVQSTDMTVEKNQTGPDGVANSATTFSETSPLQPSARYFQTAVPNDSQTYTASCYFKKTTAAATFPGLGVIFLSGTNVISQITINTDNGTLTNRVINGIIAPLNKTIEDAGDYWRVSVTQANNSSGDTKVRIDIYAAVNSDASGSWTAVATGSTVIYGAQLEVGSVPSSYIPTAGATATRAAETLQIDAANMPAYTDAVSLATKGTMTGASSTIAQWQADASNNILIASGASDFTFTQEVANVVDTVTGGSYTSGVNVGFNLASRHGSTFINGAIDGTALTANTTPTTLADLSTAPFQLASIGIMNIGRVLAWPEDIGDTGIEEASA